VKSGHEAPSRNKGVSFDRESMSNLCDATVVSLEGDQIQAHRCILAARLEYFNSMFAHGWAEVRIFFSQNKLKLIFDFGGKSRSGVAF